MTLYWPRPCFTPPRPRSRSEASRLAGAIRACGFAASVLPSNRIAVRSPSGEPVVSLPASARAFARWLNAGASL